MNFAPRENDEPTVALELRAEQVSIVCLRYLFGQSRIQVWRWGPAPWPDILDPQF